MRRREKGEVENEIIANIYTQREFPPKRLQAQVSPSDNR